MVPSRRAATLIGPEYGTVGRQDIVAAAREAVDARFDVLIACAFNFDAHSSELGRLGSLKILDGAHHIPRLAHVGEAEEHRTSATCS